MRKQLSHTLLAGALGLAVVASSGCTTKVTRLDEGVEVALSDRWNAKDSELVANAMIDDMLSFPWARDFEFKHSARPAVIVQHISNKSHEHIAIDTFINDLKRAVMRSGRADFVVGGDERDTIREERREQELNSKNAKAQGQEQAADFALSGSINSIVDQVGKKRVTFYQVDLKLIDMESNREVWNGQKKISKAQNKAAFGF